MITTKKLAEEKLGPLDLGPAGKWCHVFTYRDAPSALCGAPNNTPVVPLPQATGKICPDCRWIAWSQYGRRI